MNTDDFEKRIQRQPLRELPGDWRQSVLQAARSAQPAAGASASPLSILNSKLSTLFWPRPQAWAALAAVWLVILGLNFLSRDGGSERAAKQAAVRSEQIIVAVQEQRRLMVQLIESNERDAEPPKPAVLQPRSEYREATGLA